MGASFHAPKLLGQMCLPRVLKPTMHEQAARNEVLDCLLGRATWPTVCGYAPNPLGPWDFGVQATQLA